MIWLGLEFLKSCMLRECFVFDPPGEKMVSEKAQFIRIVFIWPVAEFLSGKSSILIMFVKINQKELFNFADVWGYDTLSSKNKQLKS